METGHRGNPPPKWLKESILGLTSSVWMTILKSGVRGPDFISSLRKEPMRSNVQSSQHLTVHELHQHGVDIRIHDILVEVNPVTVIVDDRVPEHLAEVFLLDIFGVVAVHHLDDLLV